MLTRRYLITRAIVRALVKVALVAAFLIGPFAGAALIGATP